MASRRPANQLKIELLPTLGRPTIATRGTGIQIFFGFAVLSGTRMAILHHLSRELAIRRYRKCVFETRLLDRTAA